MSEFEKTVPSGLRALMKENRAPHAVAIESPDKTALERCARLIAQWAVCTGENRPCGDCRACKKLISGNHPDVYFAKLEGKRNTVKISEVRAICADAVYKPNDGDCKVYIIPEADKMEAAPQNALLKLIEEPPQPMMFIFLCENAAGLLQTIRSRCTVFKLDTDERNDGHIKELADNIALALCRSRESELMYACAVLDDRQQTLDVLKSLSETIRGAMFCEITGRSSADAVVNKLSRSLKRRGLMNMQKSIAEAAKYAERNVSLALVSAALSKNLWNDKYL